MRQALRNMGVGLCYVGLALPVVPAIAQSAEDTINIGLDVQINPPPGISRLNDIGMTATKADIGYNNATATDPFCIFVPGSDSFSLRTIGTNQENTTGFKTLQLEENQSSTGFQLDYNIRITTTDGRLLHGTEIPDKETTGIQIDDLTNGSIPDCDGSENVVLKANVSLFRIEEAVFALPPGLTYNFADQLTLIIAPDI